MSIIISIIFWILVIIIGGLGANLLHDFIDCFIYCANQNKDKKSEAK